MRELAWDGDGRSLAEYLNEAELVVEDYEEDSRRGGYDGRLFWLGGGATVEVGVGRYRFYSWEDPRALDGWPISREKAKLLLALHFWLEENKLLGNL